MERLGGERSVRTATTAVLGAVVFMFVCAAGCAFGSGPDGDDALGRTAGGDDTTSTKPNETPAPSNGSGRKDGGAAAADTGAKPDATGTTDPGTDPGTNPDKNPKADAGRDATPVDATAPDANVTPDATADVTVEAAVPEASVPDASVAEAAVPLEASVPVDAGASIDTGVPGPATTADFCPLNLVYYNKLIIEMADNPNWRDCTAQTLCQDTHCCYAQPNSSGVCVPR